MSANNDVLMALLRDNGGVMPGLRPTSPAGRMDPAGLAFQTQMRMAQALFTEPDKSGSDDTGMSLDTSIVNDGLLMDALSTITRIMNQPDLSQVRVPVAKADGPEDIGEAALTGGLAAMFESGKAGVAAVGYDRVGGTSYGTYQIASRPGSMKRFLTFLKGVNPDWAKQLADAGPANTGSTRGAMPEAWKAIAAADPEGFEKAQHDFISKEYYTPARNKILARMGLDVDKAPTALREVLWSTAVQHGPSGAADIFTRSGEGVADAWAETADTGLFRDLIANIYENRQTRFGGSSNRVQQSVKNRLSQEMELALNMMEQGGALNSLV